MLSIIIPTYNEEKTLPTLLRSIKEQDFDDYEVVVADNNSTDTTQEVAQKFGARVVEGGLPGAGRNLGAKAAKGEKLLFLDADVVLPHPRFLSNTVREFDRRAYDIATCRILPLSEKRADRLFHWVYNHYSIRTARVFPHAPGFCIFARRHIHEKINGFDEDIKLAEDHDYTQRAVQYGNFGFLSESIPVSVRRFDKEGRIKIAIKYIFCDIYMFFLGGVKSDIFRYRFGYHDDED